VRLGLGRRLEPGPAIGHNDPHGVREDLDVQRDPALAAGTVADAVREELGDQQPQLGELLRLKVALEAVERVAPLASGLRTGTQPHVETANDFVAAQVEWHPSGCPALFRAALEALNSFVSSRHL
jgi:hypothetical protein